MAFTRGRCTNFDYCTLADKRQDIEVRVGDDFVCPECGRALKPPPVSGKTLGLVPVLAGGAVLVLIGGGMYAAGLLSRPAAPVSAAAIPGPAPAAAALQAPAPHLAAAAPQASAPAAPAIPEHVLLRLSGSNTVGAELGPLLAKAFMTANGDTDVAIEPGAADEVKVTGLHDGARDVITVAAHGSATAFTDLAAGRADVGMASRRVKPAEAASLTALGDVTSAAGEHVLALDGIAVIVNPGNPVASLSKDQLRGIFSGAVTNWSQLGGKPGAIDIFARDDKSGTFDTFKALVLNGAKLSPTAHRVEDSRALSADVSGGANAIGFIGLPYILSAKPVAVSDTGATALLPNRLTVGTEDYALSRRLFLYTATLGGNPLAHRFADFALSPEGQAIAEKVGFIPLTIKQESAPVPQTASLRYRAEIGHATRLSTNFRFLPNSADLDNRGQRDLDRLVNFVVSQHAASSNLILVGFADNKGAPAANLAVSKKRAQAVAAALEQHGVKVGKVLAFGSDLPVADNNSDDGREKNRRVEVYMTQL